MQITTFFIVASVARFRVVAAWSGNFVISNIEASASNTTNSTASTSFAFDFGDEGTPEFSTHCSAEWAVNEKPPTGSHPCNNDTFTLEVLGPAFNGLDDLVVSLSHTYYDDSVGNPPYNVLSKFGNLTLNSTTANYTCSDDGASCHSVANITALVTSAVA